MHKYARIAGNHCPLRVAGCVGKVALLTPARMPARRGGVAVPQGVAAPPNHRVPGAIRSPGICCSMRTRHVPSIAR